MGTPDFAAKALEAVIAAGHELVCVVTQPDRPKGRGKEMAFSPVKECALSHHIPVFQPVKIKESKAVQTLRAYGADIFIVAAFGQLLPQEILDMPRFGCVNIHASLLPKYRGAAPIQWALINGEAQTGITIMQMDAGLDTGDILLQEAVPIAPKETGESLYEKLAKTGADLIVAALGQIAQGVITPKPQDDAKATYVGMIKKTLGDIDFNQGADAIERLVRGVNPWPGAYTLWRGKTLKIWEADVCEGAAQNVPPGTVLQVTKEAVTVQTKDGAVSLLQVQLEGKKRMSVKDFLLGYRIEAGERLGRV